MWSDTVILVSSEVTLADRKLLVVVPALNEEATVGDVVRGALASMRCDVLVVDDGSTDATAAIAQRAGALVIQHPFNLGVGAAIRSGFRVAVDRRYDVVLQLDADGQHEVADAGRLVERLESEPADMVVGSRFAAGYEVGRLRRLSMRFLSRVVSRQLGVRITDTTSGFRAFGKRSIERFALSYPSAYLSDTVEALLLAADWNFTVVEEPVRMRERQGGKPSASSARSAFHFVRLSLVVLLHRVRRPLTQRGASPDVQA